MAPFNLKGSVLGLNQPEPPEGRKMIVFPTLDFSAGPTSSFQWSEQSLGNADVSSIVSMWVDATAMMGNFDSVSLQIGNQSNQNVVLWIPSGTFPAPGAPQGFFIIPNQKPLSLVITAAGHAGAVFPQPVNTNTVKLILFNYNVLLTGVTDDLAIIQALKGGKHINAGGKS